MLLSCLRSLKKTHLGILCPNVLTSHYISSNSEQIPDDIPYIDLYENTPETSINIRDFCCGRKIILFGLPGAFTPICDTIHLRGFISKAEEFKKLGVDEIACISVNDPYVMCAWGKYHNAQGKVRMLADTNANLTKALNMCIDLPMLGGIRSKRYSMIVANTRIYTVNVEPDGVGISISCADELIV